MTSLIYKGSKTRPIEYYVENNELVILTLLESRIPLVKLREAYNSSTEDFNRLVYELVSKEHMKHIPKFDFRCDIVSALSELETKIVKHAVTNTLSELDFKEFNYSNVTLTLTSGKQIVFPGSGLDYLFFDLETELESA